MPTKQRSRTQSQPSTELLATPRRRFCPSRGLFRLARCVAARSAGGWVLSWSVSSDVPRDDLAVLRGADRPDTTAAQAPTAIVEFSFGGTPCKSRS